MEPILISDSHRNQLVETSMRENSTNKMGHNSNRTVKRYKRRRVVKLGSPSSFEVGDFPYWLLTEILSRLPIKLVFRCKCVSKHWLSVISDPSFSRFYLSRAYPLSLPHCPWAFVPQKMHVDGSGRLYRPDYKRLEDFYSGNLSFPDSYVLPLPNSQEAKGELYRIKAVSNGFVLYGWHRYHGHYETLIADEYYVCNPTTKQWFALLAPKCSFRRVSEAFIAQVDAGILTSYKVVLLNCPEGGRTFLELSVFSSETGEWVEYSMKPKYGVIVSAGKRAVVLNNNVHWESRRLGIIAYDPYSSPDKFRVIEFPDEYSKKESFPMRSMCDVHQGHLKFCEITDPYEFYGSSSEFKVWVLEDYSTDRWSLQHSIKKQDILIGDKLFFERLYIMPAAFHPYDADIVYLTLEDYNLVSYNMRTRRLEAFGIQKKPEERNLRNMHGLRPIFLLEFPLCPVYMPPCLFPLYTSRWDC